MNIDEMMAESCNDFCMRFQRAFNDIQSGTEIIGDKEIYARVFAFFGYIPFVMEKDHLWWARGMKAMPIKELRFEDGDLYYFAGIECKITRIIPFDCLDEPEKSFVYLDCDAMPSIRNHCSSGKRAHQSWNVEPLSFYNGQLISEEAANEGIVIDWEGNRVEISYGELIRFIRFISPQNLLLTAKACPVVNRESVKVWDKMDEILAGTGTLEELRKMIQEEACYVRS